MKTIKLNTMRKLILSAAICAVSFTTVAQVGVGTTDPKATLDITGDKGMLLPRIADHTTLVPVDGTLDANEAGLQVYNTTTNTIMLWNGSTWSTASDSGISWLNMVGVDTDSGASFKISPDGVNTATDSLSIRRKDASSLTMGLSSLDKAAAISVDGKFYSALHVTGSGSNNLRLMAYNGTQDNPTLVTNQKVLGYLNFSGHDNDAQKKGASVYARTTQNWYPGGNGTKIVFETTANNTTGTVDRMTIFESGKVGIGTSITNPSANLDVEDSFAVTSATQPTLFLNSGASSHPSLVMRVGGVSKWNVQSNYNNDDALRFWGRTNELQNILVLKQSGNVGVGTILPTTKLEVAGSVKIGNDGDTATNGTIRYNTATNTFEGYANGAWVALH